MNIFGKEGKSTYKGAQSMNIVIAGDGKVGRMLTRQLIQEGHDITVIDKNPDVLEASIEQYDVMSVQGNAASMEVLREAGVEKADLLITATNQDEINLLCCMTAHFLNPGIHTIARIRTPEYAESVEKMRKVFALSLTVNPERQAAHEIERILKYPGFLKREKFANGAVELVELKVTDKSPLKNQSLMNLSNIVHCQIIVCAVVRDGECVTPEGSFVLKEGDLIFVTASSQNLTILLKSLGLMTHKAGQVIVTGGGRISYYLARRLLREGISVKIIEKERERCEELAELLPNARIVLADASNETILERENIKNNDALVNLTGLDELNVLLSIYGDRVGVPQVVTKLSHYEDVSIFENLPIGGTVSPKELCTNAIVRYVRAMQNQVGAAITVHSIANGKAEAIEFIVDEQTKHCDEMLKNVPIKKGVIIASIYRGKQIIFPYGDSSFRKGDRLVVVSSGDIIQNLNEMFTD